MPMPTVASPALIQLYREDAGAVRAELLAGLTRPDARVAPKFLYDALGSRLFEAITLLPEYYPTRVEASIFEAERAAISMAAGPGTTLIDLGAGNGEKAAGLFEALRPAHYVAVDISVDFLKETLLGLQRRHPDLPMLGLGMDFSETLALPEAVPRERRLFFYPGSSLGNFTPDEALAFLRRVRAQCDAEGGLLLGLDLVKDKAVLDAAYDDALGVTAAFNLNLLRRVNSLLGSDFSPADWAHVAFYAPERSRIEMHLEARRDLVVQLPDGPRRFAPGERIHTENSYKYRREDVLRLVEAAGFARPRLWTDARGWFAVCHAAAR